MSTQQENLLNQAKTLLITQEHFTEEQAHRFLQKGAMNLRITKTECALAVIEKYNQKLEQKQATTFPIGENSPFGNVLFYTTEVGR